jgi:endonuclease-3 related protein
VAPRTRGKPLIRYYRRLYRAYGPQGWWPGDGPFEVAVGAILTQNTAWKNVERAIANLKKARLLQPAALHRVPLFRLSRLIRPSGYFNAKARTLKRFAAFLVRNYGGSPKKMFREEPGRLRRNLLEINGIGPETADSILLYGGGIPYFVVDAYTRRIVFRHRLMDPKAGYHEIQERFQSELFDKKAIYNEFHALIVKVGKDHCSRKPHCRGCPLEPFLEGRPPGILKF